MEISLNCVLSKFTWRFAGVRKAVSCSQSSGLTLRFLWYKSLNGTTIGQRQSIFASTECIMVLIYALDQVWPHCFNIWQSSISMDFTSMTLFGRIKSRILQNRLLFHISITCAHLNLGHNDLLVLRQWSSNISMQIIGAMTESHVTPIIPIFMVIRVHLHFSNYLNRRLLLPPWRNIDVDVRRTLCDILWKRSLRFSIQNNGLLHVRLLVSIVIHDIMIFIVLWIMQPLCISCNMCSLASLIIRSFICILYICRRPLFIFEMIICFHQHFTFTTLRPWILVSEAGDFARIRMSSYIVHLIQWYLDQKLLFDLLSNGVCW